MFVAIDFVQKMRQLVKIGTFLFRETRQICKELKSVELIKYIIFIISHVFDEHW